jgi:hypothetical protein
MRPSTNSCTRAVGAPSPNTATASSVTCASICSTWFAGCSTSAGPRISSTGGILVDKNSKANIPDTQTAIFDYGDLQVTWNHRTWGGSPDPKYQWGATLYGDKGTLKASVFSYDFTPLGGGEPLQRDVLYELEEYPEDKTEKDLEKHVAPAMRRHWVDFLKAVDNRSRPVADIEQGHISSASCILANLALNSAAPRLGSRHRLGHRRHPGDSSAALTAPRGPTPNQIRPDNQHRRRPGS